MRFPLCMVFIVWSMVSLANPDALIPATLEDLTAEADHLSRNGDITKAIDRLIYAQSLVHRTYGVRSMRQIEILDQLTPLYLAQNDAERAYMTREFAYFLYRQAEQTITPGLVQALTELGDYYASQGYLEHALSVYNDAMKMVKRNNIDPVHKVEALRGIAEVHLLNGYPMLDGIKALVKAQEILSASTPGNSSLKAQTAVELADIYMVTDEFYKAFEMYEFAWNQLENDSKKRHELFSQPRLLFPTRFRTPFLFQPNSEDIVDVEFNITAFGRAEEYKGNTEITWIQNMQIRRWLDFTRYRPRILAGTPVATNSLNARQVLASLKH